jgi:ribosomal protein S18 acetylase RimI-like enzyme
MTTSTTQLRTVAAPRDRERIREIVVATEMFQPPEADVAVELIDDRLAKGDASDYHFLFVDEGTTTLGYACYGYNTMTQSSWELYWIAVDPRSQGKGVGRQLLDALERDICRHNGTQLYVETSGRARYAPTRGFYLANGYSVAATLADFYAPGDAKVIFVKVL